MHGGVAFPPYRSLFEHWIGRPVDLVEVYPASEGFVALQTERAGGLTLMLDYGIFYEFIPVEDLGLASPRRHTVGDLELGRAYAVVLSTPAGLWSYLLGDTVRFVADQPLRLEITGRTRHFVNAFGENVIVEEVERALVTACRRAHAEAVEFTVAPRYPSPGSRAAVTTGWWNSRSLPGARWRSSPNARQDPRALNTDYRDQAHGRRGDDRAAPRRTAGRDLLPVDARRRPSRRSAQGAEGHQRSEAGRSLARRRVHGALTAAGA